LKSILYQLISINAIAQSAGVMAPCGRTIDRTKCEYYVNLTLLRSTAGVTELEFHRCRACGCVTHWTAIDKTMTKMGINGRLFDEADVAQVPVQQSDGPA
jgi:hypothetical protein